MSYALPEGSTPDTEKTLPKKGKSFNSLNDIGALHATQLSFSRRYSGLLIQSSLTSIDFSRLRQSLSKIPVNKFGFAEFLKVLKN